MQAGRTARQSQWPDESDRKGRLFVDQLVELARRYSSTTNLGNRLTTALERASRTARPAPQAPRPRTHKLSQRLDPAVVVQLAADYEAGLSSERLMAKYHLGKGPVLKLLHEQGVTLRRTAIDPAEVERAVQLYAQGLSCLRIATDLNHRPSTIWSMLTRAGVQLRGAHDRS